MAIEVNADNAICHRCGLGFSKRKSFFQVCYASLYKGLGYLPYCKDCVDDIYGEYLAKSNDPKIAVRQTCRKLDLYWNETLYETSMKRASTRSVMTRYIAAQNRISCAGKSYDDTLADEGTLWSFEEQTKQAVVEDNEMNNEASIEVEEPTPKKKRILKSVVDFWGTGYSDEMYELLEQRKKYYESKFPEAFVTDGGSDIGSDILMRQLCNLEVSISKDAAAGKSIDKSVNSLNTLIGSLNLKPAQKKDGDGDSELSSTPLGVWLNIYEHKRPLPEIDDQLKDVNHVKKYVFTWLGHLVKLLGIKNGYSRLYEEEISRLRVEKPEYADDDDEGLLISSYSSPDYGGDDG